MNCDDLNSDPPSANPLPDRLLLQWHITERCNLRCRHCYQQAYNSEELAPQNWLDVLEQFDKLLANLRARGHHPRVRGHITLTGGEPFIHPNFIHLLELLAAQSRSFAILTNATLIDEPLAHKLAALQPTFIQVSIDGTQERHDSIRGPGQHARAVAAIRRLVAARLNVYLSFTAGSDNFRDFPHVARLAVKLGAKKVWADRLIPAGAGAKLETLDPSQTQEFIEILQREQHRFRNSKTQIAADRALQFLASAGEPYSCSAGRTLLALMPNGDLVPCRRMPIVIGNIRSRSLSELYFDHPVLKQLRDPDTTPVGCTSCFYRHLCRGGLRCLAYALHQRTDIADPGCWLKTTKIPSAQSPALIGT